MENQQHFSGLMIEVSEEAAKSYMDNLVNVMEMREKVFREEAQMLFDAVSTYPADDPTLIFSLDPTTGKPILKNPEGEALDSAIGKLLSHRSIGYFMEVVLKSRESAKQAVRAFKRHAENRAMKVEVFQWLDTQTKFKSIESAAMAITKQQPIAHVTARDWYKEWKKLRSASTP